MDPREENWLAAEMTVVESETEDFSEGIRASVESLINHENDDQQSAHDPSQED
jgi:hypothetical protein